MMKSLSCVLLLFVCNVIHSNCCLKKEERDLIDSVKQQLLIGCKDVRKNIDSYIQEPIDILKKEAVGKKIKIDILNFTFKVVDDEYIKISNGRDFADCLVNQGIFTGNVTQKQEISVVVEEICE